MRAAEANRRNSRIARRRGTCHLCGGPIVPGDVVAKLGRRGRWVHLACVDRALEDPGAAVVSAPIRDKAAMARWPGRCRYCRQAIARGDPIVKVADEWLHDRCSGDDDVGAETPDLEAGR